jgi:hypothetical protein
MVDCMVASKTIATTAHIPTPTPKSHGQLGIAWIRLVSSQRDTPNSGPDPSCFATDGSLPPECKPVVHLHGHIHRPVQRLRRSKSLAGQPNLQIIQVAQFPKKKNLKIQNPPFIVFTKGLN